MCLDLFRQQMDKLAQISLLVDQLKRIRRHAGCHGFANGL